MSGGGSQPVGRERDERSPIRVLVVDDHRLFRAGVRALLEDEGCDVVGEAADGESGVHLCAELNPDVALVDFEMPGITGIETTRRIRERSPGARVVVLTVSAEGSTVIEALLAGAIGYLLKDAGAAEIAAGVRAAAAGGSPLSPQVAPAVIERLRADAPRAMRPPEEVPELTPRELEILGLLVDGKDNRQVAAELVISPRTAKNHVSNILEKLAAPNRVQAAIYAVRNGIIDASRDGR